jgi:hypothetical protein
MRTRRSGKRRRGRERGQAARWDWQRGRQLIAGISMIIASEIEELYPSRRRDGSCGGKDSQSKDGEE